MELYLENKSFKHELLNHLIAGLDFPHIFIPLTQGGPILAVLLCLFTEPNYIAETLLILVQFSLGIIFQIFIEIFYKLTTNSRKKLLTPNFLEKSV